MGDRFLVVIIILFSASLGVRATDHKDLLMSVARAERFLSDKEVIAEVGSLFLKQKVSPQAIEDDDVPDDDAFAKLFGARFAAKDLSLTRTIDSDLILRGIPALRPLNNYFYTVPEKFRKKVLDPWDDILIKALYCDSTGYDDLDFSILATVRDNQGGYYDTHQLLGLLMLEENGCYDGEKITSAKGEIVDDIAEALDKDTTFSDLYAERVACLFWAGARHRVKPEWIMLIKDAQRDDGGWADIGLSFSGSHPTGLAAASVKYFVNQNEEPFFYRR